MGIENAAAARDAKIDESLIRRTSREQRAERGEGVGAHRVVKRRGGAGAHVGDRQYCGQEIESVAGG